MEEEEMSGKVTYWTTGVIETLEATPGDADEIVVSTPQPVNSMDFVGACMPGQRGEIGKLFRHRVKVTVTFEDLGDADADNR